MIARLWNWVAGKTGRKMSEAQTEGMLNASIPGRRERREIERLKERVNRLEEKHAD